MEFDPIVLRYDGLAANGNLIDLAQIGQSLQGAAQLIGTAASIVQSGEYAKQVNAMPVRIYAGVPTKGSWEIPAIVAATAPVIMAEFPVVRELGKLAATKAATAIVGYAVKVFGNKAVTKSETEMALGFAEKALAEAGQTQRHAMDAVVRMAEMLRPAARMLVVPVGLSCETLLVGDPQNGAPIIDREMRAAIDAPEDVDIQPAARHQILISEMDRVNATCKFAFQGDETARRITGEIRDPIIQSANDPYSAAFSAQQVISVMGKLQIKKGDPDRLYISDIVTDN